MINPVDFLEAFRNSGITAVTGVPDSLLKEFCATIELTKGVDNVRAANEGGAIGFAIGHYLATKKPALVYLQNSGLGNCINPLTSLADELVYGIPMVMIIGWRGEIEEGSGTQIKDEPQHKKQGKITMGQLELLGIKYWIIDRESHDFEEIIKRAVDATINTNSPVALVVRRGSFEKASNGRNEKNLSEAILSREDCISTIVNEIGNLPVISTTGMTSRELYETRIMKGEIARDFMMVGGMGHASQVALGVARSVGKDKVVCIDGDGSISMHLGSLITAAKQKNLIHIVLNNRAHDSVGGQPTVVESLDLQRLGRALGYSLVLSAKSIEGIRTSITKVKVCEGSSMLIIDCKKGARKDLGRPKSSPSQNKETFMKFIGREA